MRRTWTALAAVLAAPAAVWAFPAGDDPKPDAAARDASKVELGRRLFFDPAVSRGGRVACASCHDPTHGFTDKAHPSADEWGMTRRRTMPLSDLSAGPFHSDGEFPTVRSLLDARIAPLSLLRRMDLERLETATSGVAESFPRSYGMSRDDPPGLVRVSDRLASEGLYASAFTAAFGDPATSHDRVCESVEAYLATLRTSESPFDRFLAGDDAALSPSAALGFALFTGKAGCAQCHDARPADGKEGRAALRDGKFHDTGVSMRTARAGGSHRARKDADEGLAARTTDAVERRRDLMKFKTPSLRDVARRGPFMHDGSLATLADVVEFYDAGAEPHAGLDPLLRKLSLSEAEKEQLLAFLFALSGDERPGVAAAPARPRPMRVRLLQPLGMPLARNAVAVVPAGDVMRGPDGPAGILVTTDADGWLSFDFPPRTHVRLHPERAGVAEIVPDCAQEPTLVAVPADRIALRLRATRGELPKRVRAVPVPKADGQGRIVEKPDERWIGFDLVRALSPGEGIYLAPAPEPTDGEKLSRRFLVPDGKGGGALSSVIDVDLRGGATSTADLTPLRDQDPSRR